MRHNKLQREQAMATNNTSLMDMPEPFMGICKYQTMEQMTDSQRQYWNSLQHATRLSIRNGDALGMSRRQLITRNFKPTVTARGEV